MGNTRYAMRVINEGDDFRVAELYLKPTGRIVVTYGRGLNPDLCEHQARILVPIVEQLNYDRSLYSVFFQEDSEVPGRLFSVRLNFLKHDKED